MRARKSFTREFKLNVLRDLEGKSLAQVCREHELQPTLVARWQREYRENPKEAFSGYGRLYKQDAKVAKYERLLGQLYAENAFLKKALEKLQQLQAEERR